MNVIATCTLWDLAADGIESSLDRLSGELGVTGVGVPAVGCAVEHIRRHEPGIGRTHRIGPGAHFRPDTAKYANTRVRPSPASWIKRTNPLKDLAATALRAAGQPELSVQAWLTCCQGEDLVAQHPAAAGKNAFGDPLMTGLCPSNPDVREYVAGMVADLSDGYGLDAIVLDGAWYPTRTPCSPGQAGLTAGPIERALLDLCLCESCRQTAIEAGLDADALARSVRTRLTAWLSDQPVRSTQWQAYLKENPLLEDHLNLRRGVITAWLQRLGEAPGCRLIYPLPDEPDAAGVDVAMVAQHVDAVLVTLRQTPLEVSATDVTAMADRVGGLDRLAVRLPAYPPHCPDAPVLVRAMTALAEAGVPEIHLDNYSLIPESRWAGWRQAIRAARRVSSP